MKDAETGEVTPVEKLSYEEAVAELETLIGTLERGSIPLADAMTAYERGSLLVQHCQKLLAATEQKITKLTGKEGDEVPFIPEDGSSRTPEPDLFTPLPEE